MHLESNVESSTWDLEAQAIQVLGFTNNFSQFRLEIDRETLGLVLWNIRHSLFGQDKRLEVVQRIGFDAFAPLLVKLHRQGLS